MAVFGANRLTPQPAALPSAAASIARMQLAATGREPADDPDPMRDRDQHSGGNAHTEGVAQREDDGAIVRREGTGERRYRRPSSPASRSPVRSRPAARDGRRRARERASPPATSRAAQPRTRRWPGRTPRARPCARSSSTSRSASRRRPEPPFRSPPAPTTTRRPSRARFGRVASFARFPRRRQSREQRGRDRDREHRPRHQVDRLRDRQHDERARDTAVGHPQHHRRRQLLGGQGDPTGHRRPADERRDAGREAKRRPQSQIAGRRAAGNWQAASTITPSVVPTLSTSSAAVGNEAATAVAGLHRGERQVARDHDQARQQRSQRRPAESLGGLQCASHDDRASVANHLRREHDQHPATEVVSVRRTAAARAAAG